MADQSTKPNRKGDGPNQRKRHRPAPSRFQMRVSTKYAPHKPAEGKALTCTDNTTLKPQQLLELYRFLKLTRLVEERLVNLYRQTKVVGGVFRSLGQEATAVGTAYALEPTDFITPLILGRSLTLNPVVILIALTFWGWMWGISGMILAVPILATFKIFCDHIEPMSPVAEFMS